MEQGFVLMCNNRDFLDTLALLVKMERINPHLLGLLWGKMLNLNRGSR